MKRLLQVRIRGYDAHSRRSALRHTVRTGASLFGAYPSLRNSGTGIAADGGASPLASECQSRFVSARFRDEPS